VIRVRGRRQHNLAQPRPHAFRATAWLVFHRVQLQVAKSSSGLSTTIFRLKAQRRYVPESLSALARAKFLGQVDKPDVELPI